MAHENQPRSFPDPTEDKLSVASFLKLRAPLGGQEIELQQIDYVHGGASLLRIRIREGKRFTVFDLDAVTAQAWANAMGEWADKQFEEKPLDGGR